MKNLLIIFLVSFLSVECIVENKIKLELTLNRIKVNTIGKKGTAVVSFRQEGTKQDFKDTTKKTCFNSTISDGNKNYKVSCGLWNSHSSSYEILIFCNIGENIPSGNYLMKLNETEPFDYGNYNVNLIAKDSPKFTKVDRNIIDLYADEQTITIENNRDSYELQFHIVSYNKEILMFSYINLDNCKAENNILKCSITKKGLLAHLRPQDNNIEIFNLDTINNSFNKLPLVSEVKIVVKDIPKKDIYIGIKQLLVKTNEIRGTVAYETNVTDVANFYEVLNGFTLTFLNKDNEGTITEIESGCSFVKYDGNPLYLICLTNYEGTNWLKEIENELIINNQNIQYNYRIQPVKNEEKIETKETGSVIVFYHPTILDFSKNNGPLSILYFTEFPNNLDGLTFNEGQKDIECKTVAEDKKKCEVTKEHFKGKNNGLYFLKHKNHLGKKDITYEIRPMKVILSSSSNGNIISLSIFYYLLVLLIMI